MFKSINKKLVAFLFALGFSAAAFAVPPGYYECKAFCLSSVGSIYSASGKACMTKCLSEYDGN